MQTNSSLSRNIFYVYIRVIAISVISLISTRYALQALGQSDFGLYNVVGGIVVVLNIFSVAMSTTTRRFINYEMGKSDGNLNMIFNISLSIHVVFSVLLLILAETIGLFYIYNFLNVANSQIDSALMVFHVSILLAVVSVINVPYQSLMTANERFKQVAFIDICTHLIKLLLTISLLYYSGNRLVLYACLMCSSTLFSLLSYFVYCRLNWKEITKLKLYHEKQIYKDIFLFNNYTVLGASSYMFRNQAANMVINYFFGTIVNGAFSIAYMFESYAMTIISNLTTAVAPRITKNYSKGEYRKAFVLSSIINKCSILFMSAIVLELLVELPFVLNLWLGETPEGALLLCKWVLLCSLARSLGEGISPYTQASGKIKWFQIASSIGDFIVIPLSCIIFHKGGEAVNLIICYTIVTLLSKVVSIVLLKRILDFDVHAFLRISYLPAFQCILIFTIYYLCYAHCLTSLFKSPLIGLTITAFFICSIIYLLGLSQEEKRFVRSKLKMMCKKIKY